MDFSTFWEPDWLDHYRINELDELLMTHMRKTRSVDRNLAAVIEAICRENHALRVRVGVLIRLLVERGVITTEEFAKRVEEAKNTLPTSKQAPTRSPAAPVATGGKLPKPPKKLPPTPLQ
jgi:hypothetical protein